MFFLRSFVNAAIVLTLVGSGGYAGWVARAWADPWLDARDGAASLVTGAKDRLIFWE